MDAVCYLLNLALDAGILDDSLNSKSDNAEEGAASRSVVAFMLVAEGYLQLRGGRSRGGLFR
jgi:hypothetical protein